jgi:hypothetical protein
MCVKPFIEIRDENTIVEVPWQVTTKVRKKRLLQYHFPNHILHIHSALALILSLHRENSASDIQNLALMYKSIHCNNASLPHGSDVEQFYIIKTFVLNSINHPFACGGWKQE